MLGVEEVPVQVAGCPGLLEPGYPSRLAWGLFSLTVRSVALPLLDLWHSYEKLTELVSPFCSIFKITSKTTLPHLISVTQKVTRLTIPSPKPPISFFLGKSW